MSCSRDLRKARSVHPVAEAVGGTGGYVMYKQRPRDRACYVGRFKRGLTVSLGLVV